MDDFWAAVAKDVGQIPDAVKSVLEYTGYVNGALAHIGDAEIAAIEEDIRHLPESAITSNEGLRSCLAKFGHNPADFRILAGEKAIIRMLAAAIKQRGINKYLKRTDKVKSAKINNVTQNASESEGEVKEKIIAFYRKRLNQSHQEQEFINSLELISVTITSTNQEVLARIKCHLCPKDNFIVCRPEKTGRWKVTNFVAHVKNVHKLQFSTPTLPSVSTNVKRTVPDAEPASEIVPKKHKNSTIPSGQDSQEHHKSTSPSRQDSPDNGSNTDNFDSGHRSPQVINNNNENDVESSSGQDSSVKKTVTLSIKLENVLDQTTEDDGLEEHLDAENSAVSRDQVIDPADLESDAEPFEDTIVLDYNISEDEDENLNSNACYDKASRSTSEPSATSSIIKLLTNVSQRSAIVSRKGMRYSEDEKQYFTYRYIQGGKELFEFDHANTPTPHIRTVQRYLKLNAEQFCEGQLMVRELKEYLLLNGYPLAVCWSEDATRITGGLEYKSSNDQLTGLVAPLGSNGMPSVNHFGCSSPTKILEHIRNYPIARNVQVAMAQPISLNAAPFCVQYYCTDNKFSGNDVVRKWEHIKTEFEREGILIVCKATDGDSRFINAMIQKMNLPTDPMNTAFGDWFVASSDEICVQDPTHLANKFRTRLMKQDKLLIIGKFQVSKVHLEELIRDVSKDQHGLASGDLSDKDKMKFRPVEKMTTPGVLTGLQQHVPHSAGTVEFLNAVSSIMASFMDSKLTPLQRVFKIWYALFLIRGWRNWCVAKFNNIQNCVTTNAYWGLEINAHSLINFIVLCRTYKIEFAVTLLQSQTCEGIFRDARAFTSTESTVVNFTIQGFESRLNRIQCKRDIMHKQQKNFRFPRMKTNTESAESSLPSDTEVYETVEQAKKLALDVLLKLGLPLEDISFEQSILLKQPKPKMECNFEFVTIPEEIIANEESQVYDASELFANVGTELNLNDSINFKRVFMIRNRNNNIIYVKKRTFIWMLCTGLQKSSTDRMFRFRDSEATINNHPNTRFANETAEEITIGEYVLLRYKEQLVVFKVHGFKFLKGKNCSCSLTTVPVNVPHKVRPRGIGLQGIVFDIIDFDGDYMLEFASNLQTIDIKNYVSHLIKPSVHSGLFYYSDESYSYISGLKMKN